MIGIGKKINLHTHTKYCDGKDEPEQMVLAAIERGFDVLGFSGHGYAECDLDCCMTRDSERRYRDDVLRLKEKYRGKIDIRLGVERDFFGEDDGFPYDYVIASVHYIEKDGEPLCVDNTAEIAEEGVKRLFGGDWEAYVRKYFETVAEIPARFRKFDIIGHFDLVTKFNRDGRFFDENAEWYREASLGAVNKLMDAFSDEALAREKMSGGINDIIGDRPVFEINTGAIAKKYLDRAYPADPIIKEIERRGGSLILSSDCHDREKLEAGFDRYIAEAARR